MSEYNAPIDDILFTMREILDLNKISNKSNKEKLSNEILESILKEAGKFAKEVLAPINTLGDKEGATLENGVVRLPTEFQEAYEKFVSNGWGSVTGSKKYGGQNLPWFVVMALNEIWQSANMSFADNLMLTQGAVELLEAHGSEEQKKKILPKLISGEWSGTMNLTEPQAGSDLSSIKTKALKDNDNYIIMGNKIYITHGDQNMSKNIIHLVLARLSDSPTGTSGISLFLCPKNLINDNGELGSRNDIRVVSLEHKLGHNASPTCVLAYGDKEGAKAEIIGPVNSGINAMFTMMNNARLNVGIQGVAIAERSYQLALSFAKERYQGKPIDNSSKNSIAIIDHPDVKRMLTEMKSQIEAMRGLTFIAAEALDLSQSTSDPQLAKKYLSRLELLTPIVKSWCTDQGCNITSIGIQVHGGMGFIEESEAPQHYRDSRILPIYEGTNGIQALDLLRRKLDLNEGETFNSLLADIKETANQCLDQKTKQLTIIGNNLNNATLALEETASWLNTTFKKRPKNAAAGATPFLNMCGWTLGGWVMAKYALISANLLNNGSQKKFLEDKILTSEFYSETYLPLVSSMKSSVVNANKCLKVSV